MTKDPQGDNSTGVRAMRHAPSVLLFVITTLLLLAADLTVKSIAFDRVAGQPVSLAADEAGRVPSIPHHEPVIAIPRILAFQLTANRGAVFGLGKGGRWVFIVFSIAAAAVIITTFCRSRRGAVVLHIVLAAILAGALGNLYDRICFGVVRDMLLLFPGMKLPFGWRWPGGAEGLYPWIFNVADVCLVLGLIVLMFIMYRMDGKPAEKKKG